MGTVSSFPIHFDASIWYSAGTVIALGAVGGAVVFGVRTTMRPAL